MKRSEFDAIQYKVICAYCGQYCYYLDDNPEDISKSDVDGIICWNCEEKSITVPESYIEVMKSIESDWNDDRLNCIMTTEYPREM